MIRRLALSLALLAPATPAWAFGIGTTIGIGEGFPVVDANGNAVPTTADGFLPSLDFHFGDIALQIHVLELLGGLSSEDFFIGANVYFGIPIASLGSFDAVIAPGAGLDLLIDPFAMGITAESQFGLTLPSAVSVGIYIVPAVGIMITDGNVDLIAAGTLQLSIWFGAGGGGGGGGGSSTAPSSGGTTEPTDTGGTGGGGAG